MNRPSLICASRSIAFVAFALGVAAGCQSGASAVTPVQLVDLEGRPVALDDLLENAATVFLFTRTDCPVANRFAPEIRRQYELYQSRGVKFYLVYVDPQETPAEIAKHLKEYQYSCPALRDPRHSLVGHSGAKATPEAVVFDGGGKIAYVGRVNDLYLSLGKPRAEATTRELADAIEAVLESRPVVVSRTSAVGCLIADLKD